MIALRDGSLLGACRKYQAGDGFAHRDTAPASIVAAMYAQLNSIELHANFTDLVAKIASGWPSSKWDECMSWNCRTSQLTKLAS